MEDKHHRTGKEEASQDEHTGHSHGSGHQGMDENDAKSVYQKVMYWLCWIVLVGLVVYGVTTLL